MTGVRHWSILSYTRLDLDKTSILIILPASISIIFYIRVPMQALQVTKSYKVLYLVFHL